MRSLVGVQSATFERLRNEPVLVGTAVLAAVFDVAQVLRFELPFSEVMAANALTALVGLLTRTQVSPVAGGSS